MLKKEEKSNISIPLFYQSLPRLEKGRFLLFLQTITTFSQSTVMARLRDDGWRPIEREAIEKAIREESWR